MALVFDATTVDPSQGVGQLPVGRHVVRIAEAIVAPVSTDEQSGKLTLVLETEGGQRGGYNLNIYNKNPESARIGWQQLSAVQHVIGRYKINHENDLVGGIFIVDVQQDKRDEKYTRVMAVFDVNGHPPTKGGQPAAQQQQAPAPQQQGTQGQTGTTVAVGPQGVQGIQGVQGAPWGGPAGQGAAQPQQQAQPAQQAAAWAPSNGGQPAASAAPWGQKAN